MLGITYTVGSNTRTHTTLAVVPLWHHNTALKLLLQMQVMPPAQQGQLARSYAETVTSTALRKRRRHQSKALLTAYINGRIIYTTTLEETGILAQTFFFEEGVRFRTDLSLSLIHI